VLPVSRTVRLLAGGCALALLLTGQATASAAAPAAAPAGFAAGGSIVDGAGAAVLQRYAADTWRSLVAMVDPATGLPADNITGDLDPASRSAYTSPTNIGGYLWSALVARELRIVDRREAVRRIRTALTTLARLDRHDPSGMYYNWYDPRNGQVVRVWPPSGDPVTPFLSSVDNGWLGAALVVVRNAVPEVRAEADRVLRTMNFGFFYNPTARGADYPAGLIRGGFWDTAPPGCSVPTPDAPGGPVWFTCNHYDVLNSEPRIASYLGIAFGQIPRQHYFGMYRTFPPVCNFGFEQKPVGDRTSTYLGVPVYEGAYRYRGMQFVPSWGGDMFESLMPDLFVPEAKWGRNSWGRNHPVIVRGQIEHGMVEAGYGYWGFSPASDPFAEYAAYGVEAMGMDPTGYPSDREGTNFDPGFEGCREPGPPVTYGDGVVTPHAVFLALPYAPREGLANLARLKANLDSYGPGGFYDAIAVRSGTVAKRYLSLDQSMIMGSIGNVLRDDMIKTAFTQGRVGNVLRPLLAIEEFNVPARQNGSST
jgi:hypothetical protein